MNNIQQSAFDFNSIHRGYCHCGCGLLTSLASQNHTKFGYEVGKPVRYRRGHGARRPAQERFWAKVNKASANGCWLWVGSQSRGYGQFRDGQRVYNAHVFSYTLHNGPIQDGLFVLHRCDVKACVNPAHLFLGTQADNMHDMVAKGRARRAKPKV